MPPEDHLRIASRFNTRPEEPFVYECRGFAALCDADAIPRIREHEDTLSQAVLDATGASPHQVLRLGDTDPAPELLVLKAHDGSPCRSWWGEDSDGNLVALVADLYNRGYHRARTRRSARSPAGRP
ncbi:hypothetical protein [Nannocystis sp. SCPEA4]|uniref:hypothetical protein n=1 Tax=Nannocystis sp. SCPEA4 TaxID=2996787 RepID=UPI002271DB7E|nr:hypothetical protein [Nannocystis sp. SCPEA4]MCY1060552.1 hypothetical protein [Nannocystis sp. SCPEA4]